MYGKPKPKPKPRPRGLAALGALVVVALLAGGVNADPNPLTAFKDSAPCVGDTSYTVTSASLDTLMFGCGVKFVSIYSLTGGMSVKARPLGNQNPIKTGTGNVRGTLPRVDYELVEIPAATDEYVGRVYSIADDDVSALIYGIIVDGTGSGSVLIEWGW